MYRLLLPGIRIKRWMLVNLIGMVVFALGFTLLVTPQFQLDDAIWRLWMHLTHAEIPKGMLKLIGFALFDIPICNWAT